MRNALNSRTAFSDERVPSDGARAGQPPSREAASSLFLPRGIATKAAAHEKGSAATSTSGNLRSGFCLLILVDNHTPARPKS